MAIVCMKKRDNLYMIPLCLLSSLCAACDYTPNIKPHCSCRAEPLRRPGSQATTEQGHFSADGIGLNTHARTSHPLLLSLSLSLSSSPLECKEHQSARSHPEDLIKDPIST